MGRGRRRGPSALVQVASIPEHAYVPSEMAERANLRLLDVLGGATRSGGLERRRTGKTEIVEMAEIWSRRSMWRTTGVLPAGVPGVAKHPSSHLCCSTAPPIVSICLRAKVPETLE